MTQDEKDLKAMALLREIHADPRKNVDIRAWDSSWVVRIDHHFLAKGPDLADAVLEAYAKSQPRAQKRCAGCKHSRRPDGGGNLKCHDPALPAYRRGWFVGSAVAQGEPCGASYSHFEQREDTHPNGDPLEP